MKRLFRILGGGSLGKRASEPAYEEPPEADYEVPSPARGDVSEFYFDTMLQMQADISKGDFESAAQSVKANLEHVHGWVKATREEYGAFDIPSIPALQQGGRILAVVGDMAGLDRMQEVVDSCSELEPWSAQVGEHKRDLLLVKAILDTVQEHPRCLQTEVKGLLGESDGRRIATLLHYLERHEKIVRLKKGRTYELLSADALDAPEPLPKRRVAPHRRAGKSPPLHEVDFSKISYIPLPRAPSRWDEDLPMRDAVPPLEEGQHFETRDADWHLGPIQKVPLAGRPDPAFRKVYPTDSGVFLVDDLGNAEGLDHHEASALRYDRTGNMAVKAGLPHGTYRIGVHPLGHGLIGMAKDAVLHAYDESLSPILETSLADYPEVLALAKKFEIQEGELKNHIRCIGLSQDERRYLFTAVDEAWCFDLEGRGLWGVRLPEQEGWDELGNASGLFHASDEVTWALGTFGLDLPVTPADVKQRYRELAKHWHPDLNQSSAGAHERMTEINQAAEILTGIDVESIPSYTEAAVAAGRIGVVFGMGDSLRWRADWIYAACFGALGRGAYLAGYSGRVVQLDEGGEAVRAYDIGSVPRRIVDTGEFLYLLTDTRLYVLREDSLYALVDTVDAGDLLVAETGFGLLESKRLRWFGRDGRYEGSVVSKNPIRHVYSSGGNLTVATRQRRVEIKGGPTFWGSTGPESPRPQRSAVAARLEN